MTTRRIGKTGQDPTESRLRLLTAATKEFADKGLPGARVDEIARKSGVNKQLIYYHFGNKDGLYVAVLERVYADIRFREKGLNLSVLDPIAAMIGLVNFTFDYVMAHRDFVALLTHENLLQGAHIRQSKMLKDMRSSIVGLIAKTLRRGVTAGVFRPGLDPVQLYVSIAAQCFFYCANIHTLSALFDRDLQSRAALEERRNHVIDFVVRYVCVQPNQARIANRKPPQP